MDDNSDHLLPTGPLSTSGNQIVDQDGNPVQIRAVNWFGGATEDFVHHGLWARDWQEMMDQMVETGFNTIRLDFSTEMVLTNPVVSNSVLGGNSDLRGMRALEIMDKIVGYAEEIGIKIFLDHHRSEAGNGASRNGLWYTSTYSEEDLITAWTTLAERYGDSDAVIGADLHNEPHGPATWGGGGVLDWAAAAERIGNAVHTEAPDWLIIVEGVQWVDGDGYWWGGNLKGVKDRPIELDIPNKVVYSPHDYPYSVAPQTWFTDGSNLYEVFNEFWGYIYEEEIGPILLGEFGSFLEEPLDLIWADAIVNYLSGDFDGNGINDLPSGDAAMSYAWWSWNPNSVDTGGVLEDDWQTVRTEVTDLLDPILNGPFVPPISGGIEGRVFADINENNIDDDEAGVEGIKVELLSASTSAVLAETTTTSDGSYVFSDLETGDYRVRFFGSEDAEFSTPGFGPESTDSDVAYVGSGGNGNTNVISVTNTPITDVDAGWISLLPATETGTVRGRYFLDANANDQDDGEDGVQGARVDLLAAGGQTIVATTTTDSTGAYNFDDVPVGDYFLRFFGTGEPGSMFSDPGAPDPTTDSDVAFVGSGGNGNTSTFSVANNATVGDMDAGLILSEDSMGDPMTGVIEGRYFLDANANDQDDGEPGLEGQRVDLLLAGGQTIVATTTTDSDGTYSFQSLAAGDYYVRFFGTSGAIFSDPGSGMSTTDSDVAFMGGAGNGNTNTITLAQGQTISDIDAGRILTESPADDLVLDASGLTEGTGSADQTVTLTNSGGDDIVDWTVALDLEAGELGMLTLGTVTGALAFNDGEDLFFTKAPSDSAIAAGASDQFSFSVTFAADESVPWQADDFSVL